MIKIKIISLFLFILFSCISNPKIIINKNELENYHWIFINERIITTDIANIQIITFLYNEIRFKNNMLIFAVIRGYYTHDKKIMTITYDKTFYLSYNIIDNRIIIADDLELLMDENYNLFLDKKIFIREKLSKQEIKIG